MSLLATPPVGGANTVLQPRTSPYCVEIAFTDNGAGGNCAINGQGVDNGSTLLDLVTFFNTPPNGIVANFRSFPLLTKFKRTAASIADLWTPEFFGDIDISVYTVGATPVTIEPSITFVRDSYPGLADGIPAIVVVGPSVAGTWRVRLSLRQSSGA